jgi:oligoribonuclease
MLVWCDLETTGLTPANCPILEIAVIVTDDALVERARFQRVVYYKGAAPIIDELSQGRSSGDAAKAALLATGAPVDPFVIEMHLKNGLWSECIRGQAMDTVDRDLATFLDQTAVVKKVAEDGKPYLDRPQLAGSSVHFDKGFLDVWLPRSASKLHYRILDVSTLNEVARRFWAAAYAPRPNNPISDHPHRGMPDIEHSISVFKHYLGALRD